MRKKTRLDCPGVERLGVSLSLSTDEETESAVPTIKSNIKLILLKQIINKYKFCFTGFYTCHSCHKEESTHKWLYFIPRSEI